MVALGQKTNDDLPNTLSSLFQEALNSNNPEKYIKIRKSVLAQGENTTNYFRKIQNDPNIITSTIASAWLTRIKDPNRARYIELGLIMKVQRMGFSHAGIDKRIRPLPVKGKHAPDRRRRMILVNRNHIGPFKNISQKDGELLFEIAFKGGIEQIEYFDFSDFNSTKLGRGINRKWIRLLTINYLAQFENAKTEEYLKVIMNRSKDTQFKKFAEAGIEYGWKNNLEQSAQVTSLLKTIVDSNDSVLRHDAVRSLLNIDVNFAEKLYDSNDIELRRLAIELLGSHCLEKMDLIHKAIFDNDQNVRIQAASNIQGVIKKIDPNIILKYSNHYDPGVRSRMILAMRKYQHSLFKERVVKALDDEDLWVKKCAVDTVKNLFGFNAIEIFEKQLKKKNNDNVKGRIKRQLNELKMKKEWTELSKKYGQIP